MNKKDFPWLHDAEYMSYVSPLLNTAEVQKLDEFTHHYISTRLIHSLNVSYTSYKISKKFGWNKKATARAGLLHDLFYYDWRETKFEEGSHAYVHPRIAYQNAKKITKISKLEKDIIIKHMWGATITPPRYKESFVVTFVDDYVAIKELSQMMKFKWRHRKHLRKEKIS